MGLWICLDVPIKQPTWICKHTLNWKSKQNPIQSVFGNPSYRLQCWDIQTGPYSHSDLVHCWEKSIWKSKNNPIEPEFENLSRAQYSEIQINPNKIKDFARVKASKQILIISRHWDLVRNQTNYIWQSKQNPNSYRIQNKTTIKLNSKLPNYLTNLTNYLNNSGIGYSIPKYK